jgi:long-subunit acyl-CoA synthetase (AMP-forming)
MVIMNLFLKFNENVQVNVPSGKCITFKEAREKSRKVASALAKMGFKKGDFLYFVTTECVDLYLIQLAVWMLGGAVRGASTMDTKGSDLRFNHSILYIISMHRELRIANEWG